MYAITDLKHGWLTWCIAVGCILRDLFPDPDAVLFLTLVTQKEFVAEFNALIQGWQKKATERGGLKKGGKERTRTKTVDRDQGRGILAKP